MGIYTGTSGEAAVNASGVSNSESYSHTICRGSSQPKVAIRNNPRRGVNGHVGRDKRISFCANQEWEPVRLLQIVRAVEVKRVRGAAVLFVS